MKKIVAYATGMTAALSTLALTLVARAAVDADISAAAGSLATSTKENAVGVVGANIGYVAILFSLMLGIGILMRLFKRGSK